MVFFSAKLYSAIFVRKGVFFVSLLKPAAVEGYLASSISLKPAKAIDPGISASIDCVFYS